MIVDFNKAKEAVKNLEEFCDQFDTCNDCPFKKLTGSGDYIITECKVGNPWEFDDVEED